MYKLTNGVLSVTPYIKGTQYVDEIKNLEKLDMIVYEDAKDG